MGRRPGGRGLARTRPRGGLLSWNGVARRRAALHTSGARREGPHASAELGDCRTRRFRGRAERLAVLRTLAEARRPDAAPGGRGGARALPPYGTGDDPGRAAGRGGG